MVIVFSISAPQLSFLLKKPPSFKYTLIYLFLFSALIYLWLLFYKKLCPCSLWRLERVVLFKAGTVGRWRVQFSPKASLHVLHWATKTYAGATETRSLTWVHWWLGWLAVTVETNVGRCLQPKSRLPLRPDGEACCPWRLPLVWSSGRPAAKSEARSQRSSLPAAPHWVNLSVFHCSQCWNSISLQTTETAKKKKIENLVSWFGLRLLWR